jgi:Icc-related predicted phosphoesterase
MEELHINVFNIVGNAICVEADDGEKVYAQISAALKAKKKVVLSFLNVEMLTSAFLNTAIGQLYRDFSEPEIKESLTVVQLEGTDRALLKRVVDTAKLFYKNPDSLEKSINEIMGD